MNDYLIFDSGKKESIGIRVITYEEPGGLSFYNASSDGVRRFRRIQFAGIAKTRDTLVKKVLIHHDGARSAAQTFSILRQRKLSTHLIIDAKGMVYQVLALADIAWHALGHNKDSVGIDMNNPIRANRTDDPTRKMFTRRINGGPKTSLGYTDAQYVSLIAVLRGLSRMFPKFNLKAPIGPDGQVLMSKLVDPSFPGILGHMHVSASKWDPGPGFDWERLLIGVRGNTIDFPITLPGSQTLASVPKKNAFKVAEKYYQHVRMGRDGFFPVGTNMAWHSGVHLRGKRPKTDEEGLEQRGQPIRAPLKGHVVVARMIDPTRMGSSNVIVLRHKARIGGSEKTFFSVFSHVEKEPDLTAKSPIEWIGRWAQNPGPGAPDGDPFDRPTAAEGYNAFRLGYVALGEIEVQAGEIIGHMGTYRTDMRDKRSKTPPEPILDFAIFSASPLFGAGDQTFALIDDDTDTGLLCNSRKVWRRFTQEPSALRSLVSGGYPLSRAEIVDFYQNNRLAREFRWIAAKHVTEWNKDTEYLGLVGHGYEFEWELREEATRYQNKIRKQLWWDKNVAKHLKVATNEVISYHPITLLTVLAIGEAREALKPGEDGEIKALSGKELKRARALDRQAEAEGGYGDLEGGAGRDEDPDSEEMNERLDINPERKSLDRWEQGEWEPE